MDYIAETYNNFYNNFDWTYLVYSLSSILIAGISTYFIFLILFAKIPGLNDSFWNYLFPTQKVDESSSENGGTVLAELLEKHGVKFIYTLVGHDISSLLVAAEKIGIKIIDTRNEATAVFAADATARLTGTIGVAAVTGGPGVTNTITAIKNAEMAQSPILIIGGSVPTFAKGKASLQIIEQLGLMKSVCKSTHNVTAVRQIIPTFKKAIKDACSGTPGPVFLEMPLDVLQTYKMAYNRAIQNEPDNKKFIEHHLRFVFGDAFKKMDMTPFSIPIIHVSKYYVSKTIGLIQKSHRPLIMIGSQALLPPTPVEDTQKALNKIGAPVLLQGMAVGLLGKNNSNEIRYSFESALKETDLIILAGTNFDCVPKNKNTKFVSIGREKLIWENCAPYFNLKGDIGEFLIQISKGLQKNYKCDPNWIEKLRKEEISKEESFIKEANKETKDHLNPIKLLKTLDRHLPDNSIIVLDGGLFARTAANLLRPRGPLSVLEPGPFYALGCGAGFALAAKLCRPDCQVWIIYGDGACGFSVIEYDTFVRHKTPILSLVGNDGCWAEISREQMALFGKNTGCKLNFSHYELISTAFGGKGVFMSKEHKGEIGKMIKECKILADDKGESVLINAFIDQNNCKNGGISN